MGRKVIILIALLSPGCLPASHVLSLQTYRGQAADVWELEKIEYGKPEFNLERATHLASLRSDWEDRIERISPEADKEAREGAVHWWDYTWKILLSLGIGVAAASGGI